MPDSDSNTIWESYLNEQFPPESPAIESDVEEQIQKISAITIEQANSNKSLGIYCSKNVTGCYYS